MADEDWDRGVDHLVIRLGGLAEWGDLVLPERQINALHDIVRSLRHRTTVYDEWGFAARPGRGPGLTALFSGPSGTGKTMAAESIANDIGLDLLVVDLSAIMNRYIGETEKNLRRVFDSAERSGAVLLFDEADALFGRRTEVKDSDDRYATLGIGSLLSRIEAYPGLAILTINRKGNIDPAFMRRLRFIVEFPYPTKAARKLIWKSVFPADAPLDDNIEFRKLAKLDLAGGSIRNVALNAAFAAADEGIPIGMEHVARAARSELTKNKHSLTDV